MSWIKTEYLKAGGVDDGEELKLQEKKIKRAKDFKYLCLTVSSNGRCEVRRRIQAGWMSWKKVLRVLCDRIDSYRQGLRVKCTRVLLDQPCFMEWKQW